MKCDTEHEILRQAIARLPERICTAVRLYMTYPNDSQTALANRIGVPQQTLSYRLARARYLLGRDETLLVALRGLDADGVDDDVESPWSRVVYMLGGAPSGRPPSRTTEASRTTRWRRAPRLWREDVSRATRDGSDTQPMHAALGARRIGRGPRQGDLSEHIRRLLAPNRLG